MGEYNHEVIRAMIDLGGSFVRLLAELYYIADEKNKQRLEYCFRDYFEEYKKFIERREGYEYDKQ